MNIKKHIPNALTCGNLFCGCLALVKAFEGDLVWAAYLVGIALVLDFFDGFTARLLKVSSPIGKDLDSLADVVTFGVVPGIVMFKMIGISILSMEGYFSDTYHIAYFAFIIPIFSAIRLAKFNNDKRQSDSFIGLPTPANAILICSIPLILFNVFGVSFTENLENYYFVTNGVDFDNEYFAGYIYAQLGNLLKSYSFFLFLTIITSYLLIAPLPLIALKFKNFSWTDNKMRFILIGLSVVMLACFQFVGIPLVIILYILLSIADNLFFKKQKNA